MERSYRRWINLFLLFIASQSLWAQKKAIRPDVYDSWRIVEGTQLSKNGEFITWQVNPQVGDGVLFLTDSVITSLDSFPRGKSVQFSSVGRFVAFRIEPEHEKVRKLKLDGKKKDDLPKDTLAIYRFADRSLKTYSDVKSIRVCDACEWMAFIRDKSAYPVKKKFRLCKKKKEVSTKGHVLTLFHPASSAFKEFKQVTEVEMSCHSNSVYFVTHQKEDKKDIYQLYHYDYMSDKQALVKESEYAFINLSVSDHHAHAAFLSSADTSKQKIYSLHIYWPKEGRLLTVDSSNVNMPKGWSPSEHEKLRFSKDEKKLFFGAAAFPYNPPKDTLLDEEKPKLDVWSWHDDRIQPEQLVSQKSDLKQSYFAVLHLADSLVMVLGNDTLPSLSPLEKGNSNLAYGSTDKGYEKEKTWAFPWKRNHYLVDMNTGRRTLLVQGNEYGFALSPSGKKVIWYDGLDSTWYGKNAQDEGNAKGTPISSGIDESLSYWTNGGPYIPGGYSVQGWSQDEKYVILKSEFSLWQCSADGGEACQKLADGNGRWKFELIDTDSRREHINLDSTLVIKGFDELTKDEAFFVKEPGKPLQQRLRSPHKYLGLEISEDGNTVLFRRMNYHDYPNLWKTDRSMSRVDQLSDANPQQKEYAWGDVQLIEWTSADSILHHGLLYTPNGAGENGKHPMIVYFYEDYSDDLHNHYYPKPTASIVFPTEYVSNNYVVFIPDIYYTPGLPGQSAYRSIMSGTDYVLKNFPFIDSTKMGLQGQSWGGYQTAYMVTQTGRYAAAMAGAPVGNMTSAYGGIRWGSGLSRIFQYERTQSRIGVPLWDSLDLYIQNSPLFYLPNVSTPLLIMHNDEDNAVPWYQGIELFMGLRRLHKPVWMLNYNGDKHNLMKRANRTDLSIRMMQFFDHYLKGAPAPSWMVNGLPAVKKGVELRYELIED